MSGPTLTVVGPEGIQPSQPEDRIEVIREALRDVYRGVWAGHAVANFRKLTTDGTFEKAGLLRHLDVETVGELLDAQLVAVTTKAMAAMDEVDDLLQVEATEA